MEMPSPEEVSDAEREGILWDATRRYLRGEISAQELQEIEDRYSLYTRRTISHVSQVVSYPDKQEKKEIGLRQQEALQLPQLLDQGARLMQMPSPEEQQIAFTRLTQLIDQAASPTDMPPPEELSYADTEGILWRAAGQYMRGEITAYRLQEIEDRYNLYTSIRKNPSSGRP